MSFALQAGDKQSHEIQTVALTCNYHRIERRFFVRPKEVPPGWVPVGSVDWVEQVLGWSEVPDYYPEFLQPWLHRRVWRLDTWPHGKRLFIKPADRHKRFTGFVTAGNPGWKGSKRGPFWCSDVVQFVSEWRAYVAGGVVLAFKWNSGIEAEAPLNEIQGVPWPPGYCGAVDFGRLSDGRLALIEANSAFSCGWYGSMSTTDGEIYCKWLEAGWLYLTSRGARPGDKLLR